jgi:hypothetical protein
MAVETNKYGLTRTLRAEVARSIRQRDGFGCVVCGFAVVDYEHFDPPFSEAREHNPDGMMLLCKRCHGNKGTFLAPETIAEAAKNPHAKRAGFSWGAFDWGRQSPEVLIGNLSCRDTPVLIRVLGDEILTVKPPEAAGAPFRLSARLCDRDGTLLLEIVENQWQAGAGNWDVVTEGARITIKKAHGDIVLVLRSQPGVRLVVERIDMEHRGIRIFGVEGQSFQVIAPGGRMTMSRGDVRGSDIGIDVTETSINMGVGGGITAITGPAFFGPGLGFTPQAKDVAAFPHLFPRLKPSKTSIHLPIRQVRRNDPCPRQRL